MFWGNIIIPAVALLVCIMAYQEEKNRFSPIYFWTDDLRCPERLHSSWSTAFASINISSVGAGTVNQYMLFILADLVFFICSLIYLASSFIVAWKEKSPEHRYKGENLFFFGQVVSKLNTTSKTMTLISITLVLAIFMFIAAPVLVGWASGYLDIRSMYDVQISSRYNDVYSEEDLPRDNYEIVTDYLAEHGIKADYDLYIQHLSSEERGQHAI